ncbi:DUF4870 domain-containing protein [Bacillus tianshenii]|nr:DUF4870 domain-containing protein [Bacillus tianshenii]
METNRILSSLCYFSIFFAGFIFPIIVYIVSSDMSTKQHAKSALLSHLIPFITIVAAVLVFVANGLANMEPSFWLLVFTALIVGGVNLVVLIWNIIKGVKVLND